MVSSVEIAAVVSSVEVAAVIVSASVDGVDAAVYIVGRKKQRICLL